MDKESLLQHILKDRGVMVKISENGDIYSKIVRKIKYYYLPEDLYNEYNRRLEEVKKRENENNETFQNETVEPIRRMFTNRDIENFENGRYPGDKQRREEARKRRIKSTPQKTNKKKYKGNKRLRIKAFFAAIVMTGALGWGLHSCNEYNKEQKEAYEQVAAQVMDLSDEEIKSEIMDILKGEISQATRKDAEDIRISYDEFDSATKRTDVEVENVLYRNNKDLRSFVNIGDTLNSNGITNIIKDVKNAKGRKELIEILKNAKKFSEEKDLKKDGGKLTEVNTTNNTNNKDER